MQRPLAVAKACFTRVNIFLDLVNAGVMLCRMTRRRLHLHMEQEQERVVGGIAASSALTLDSRMDGRRRRWRRVSSYHPKITFWVDQAASPCNSFFYYIGSLILESLASLGWNTLSMVQKRFRIICDCLEWPHWKVEIKFSR